MKFLTERNIRKYVCREIWKEIWRGISGNMEKNTERNIRKYGKKYQGIFFLLTSPHSVRWRGEYMMETKYTVFVDEDT